MDEEFFNPEQAEWRRMTPAERWKASEALWQTYLALGGSLDPEPDTQTPFYDADEWRALFADRRPSLRAVRRSGI